jgi:hypothetical protein
VEVGVALDVAVAVGVAVAVAVGVGVGVNVAVAVAVGVGLIVGVAVAVGDGVGVPALGTNSATNIGLPVLKKPIEAPPENGGALASNRKLYNVPQRIALAF